MPAQSGLVNMNKTRGDNGSFSCVGIIQKWKEAVIISTVLTTYFCKIAIKREGDYDW